MYLRIRKVWVNSGALFTKGNRMDLYNYSGIAFTDVVTKVFSGFSETSFITGRL